MEMMSYRVLDTLARVLGDSLSIRALARQVAQLHGTGAYPNVYHEVQRLQAAGLVRLDEAGRAHTVHLDVEASRDVLAQRDLQRMEAFVHQHPRFHDRAEALHDVLFHHGAAGVLFDPERGVRANRIGLIVLARGGHETILQGLGSVSRRHQTPIDAVPLMPAELVGLVASRAWNPVPDWIRGGIAFHHPQAVWHALRGIQAWPKPEAQPGVEEVLGALPALGYREMGAPEAGRSICAEEAATWLLQSGEPRRVAAAAVVLAKNRPTPGLLHGLALRRSVAGEMMTLLRLARPRDTTIHLLEASGVGEASLDEAHIESTLAKHA